MLFLLPFLLYLLVVVVFDAVVINVTTAGAGASDAVIVTVRDYFRC